MPRLDTTSSPTLPFLTNQPRHILRPPPQHHRTARQMPWLRTQQPDLSLRLINISHINISSHTAVSDDLVLIIRTRSRNSKQLIRQSRAGRDTCVQFLPTSTGAKGIVVACCEGGVVTCNSISTNSAHHLIPITSAKRNKTGTANTYPPQSGKYSNPHNQPSCCSVPAHPRRARRSTPGSARAGVISCSRLIGRHSLLICRCGAR
jgi:hypothetical protein